MNTTIKHVAQEVASNPKIATVIATSTAGTGVGTILDLIPDDIGKLATLIGIVLSSVLIYTHLRKGRIEYKKTQLEIKILMDKEESRRKADQEFKNGIDRRKGGSDGLD